MLTEIAKSNARVGKLNDGNHWTKTIRDFHLEICDNTNKSTPSYSSHSFLLACQTQFNTATQDITKPPSAYPGLTGQVSLPELHRLCWPLQETQILNETFNIALDPHRKTQ